MTSRENAISDDVADIKSLLERIDERTERTDEQVDKLTHVLLEGNGSPAVTVSIATLSLKVANLEEAVRVNHIPRPVWLGILVSTIIGVVGIVVAML